MLLPIARKPMQPQMELSAQQELPVSSPVPELKSQTQWNPALKIGFRFAFCYLGLYCFPFPIDSLPYTEKVTGWYGILVGKAVGWFAQHILHLGHPVTPINNGSGDTTYAYLVALFSLV